MRGKINLMVIIFILMGILGFVLAADPTWKQEAYNITYYFNEDNIYFHNFTVNLTDYSNLSHISVLDISWSEDGSKTTHPEYTWLPWDDTIFSNSTKGVMKLNSTTNNETGNFTLNVFAQGVVTGQSTYFNFIINATNDLPNFTNVYSEYNLSQDQLFINYTNAFDEEEHYPLFFNISFFNNCSLASWSSRTNCSLLSLTNISDTQSLMNFTPSRNDVGTYWANISVRDYGENYTCPHAYCVNSSYQVNKTTSSIVVFNVLSSLTINASDCQNLVFQEGVEATCEVNISTKGDTNTVNITSDAEVRNYAGYVLDESWYYSENVTSATNFNIVAKVNVTPQKSEIGNWSINFTVRDNSTGEITSEQIYIYVNRTTNDVLDLSPINNINTSVNLLTTINLTVYDDDLLIPDKFEGYNETITFNVTILNQSDLGQELSLSGFDVEIISMPVAGTNRTEAKIEFTPNITEVGNYTINITVNDNDNTIDSDLFNLSIYSNEYPSWNQTEYNFSIVVNYSLPTTQAFGPIDLTNGYVNDTVGDTLSFTNGSSAFPRFSLSGAGVISFTPYKEDVGYWNFTVTVTDSLGLQNQTTFRFNITNINTNPAIETPLQATNAIVNSSNSHINIPEDNYTTITLWIEDDDIRIQDSQKSYYNESLSINLTIVGNNTNLFNFTQTATFPTPNFPNRSSYEAIFTPNNSDVGEYNITINVTDASGVSDLFEFNLTVTSVNDFPTLTSLENSTSAVARNFYYDINASDEEDGDDSDGNLTFVYNFLSGDDIFNSTVFNSTSGIVNITFNSSQGGIYQINITVNDTTNNLDSEIFYLTVYDTPNINYPSVSDTFTLQENVMSNLNFTVNHSVGNNLTYDFYINGTAKYNLSYFGNNTNLTWQFTPNFTDETYGDYLNLTLVVYPSSASLVNNSLLNQTMNWELNISHANAPVVFSGYIGDKSTTYSQNIQINLSEYFSDIDYSDENYNQSIDFSISSNSNPSYITSSVSANWILTLSSLIAVTEILNITANDSGTNATSNNFEVEFTAPTVVTTPTSGGGGGGGSGSTIVSLKIIVPEPVSANKIDRITVPIQLYNDGTRTLSGINLSAIIAQNNILRDDISISFNKSYFSYLNVGAKEEVEMVIEVNTEANGSFEITLNASVNSPTYNDWAKLFLTIKDSNESLKDKLIFVQEFLEENPECIELEELIDEANAFFEAGDFINTVVKIQEAINGCKNAISQQARSKRKEPKENLLYRYLFVATIFVFVIGVGYYSFQRMKLRKGSGDYFTKNTQNKISKY